jgi:iron complex transport system substrate-binding protein
LGIVGWVHLVRTYEILTFFKPFLMWSGKIGRMCALFVGIVTLNLSGMAVQAQSPRESPSVISLDMCADQYVLGLMPRNKIIGLSSRAILGESYYKDRAKGLRRVTTHYESILALKPDAVVRTYGGDHRLIQALETRGIKIIQINVVHSFIESKNELLRLGRLLDQNSAAQIEIHQFDKTLKDITPLGRGRSILYYTPSGYSAGRGTMIGDMLLKAGYSLETQNPDYFYIGPEVFLGLSPDAYALGFFDEQRQYFRAAGRNRLIAAKIAKKPNLVFPQRALACAGWFNVYDLHDLSQQAGHSTAASLTNRGGQ